ncbi:MAG TPA: HAD family hydrolase [Gemmataceae bacterium]|jgi:phosphoglycolate phosphatase-like HAD superfamily hydrolase
MRVCLFDIDGTLIASGGAGKAALEAALAEEFGVPHILDKLQLSGRTDRAIVSDLFRMHVIDDTPENHERLRDAYLRHLPHYLHAGRVLPGIAELLTYLARRTDVAVGLLTGNVRAGAKVKLGYFGLYDYFAFGGFGDHHLDRDDVAHEAWTEVRRRFNGSVLPESIWVIGDTPLDIRCARAIGAQAVAVATGWHSVTELAAHRPDLLLADLADPAPLLSHWELRSQANLQ